VEKLKELELSKEIQNEVEKLIDKNLAQIPENQNNAKKENNFFPGYVKWVLAGAAVGVALYFWWKRSH